VLFCPQGLGFLLLPLLDCFSRFPWHFPPSSALCSFNFLYQRKLGIFRTHTRHEKPAETTKNRQISIKSVGGGTKGRVTHA